MTSSTPSGPVARPSLLKRLLSAQESGLIFVILLLGLALTFFGGTKPAQVKFALPQDAVVSSEGGTLAITFPSGAAAGTDFASTLGASLPASAESANLKIIVGGQTTGLSSARTPRVLDGPPRELMVSREESKFLNTENLILLATQASFIAVMAVGMTAVIVLGGIDLSVGSIYGLAAVIGAGALQTLQRKYLGLDVDAMVPSEGGAPLWLSLPIGVGVCMLVGAACGAFSGSLIVGLRVHPFIITLGMMAVLSGIVFVRTQGQSITGFPESFTKGFMKLQTGNVYPIPMIIMVVIMLAGMFALSRLVIGRRVFAIGGNETAAYYAGIPVGRVKIIVFTCCGALAGLSAAMYLGYYGAAAPGAGQGYELSVIAAAVIGGASLSGGKGSAFGAVLGALLVQMINNGMLVLEIDQAYTQIVMGAAIVAAVVLDQTKARFTKVGR